MKLAKILRSKRHNINRFSEGLRTLVISQKLLDTYYFDQWNIRYAEAKADLNNREQSV